MRKIKKIRNVRKNDYLRKQKLKKTAGLVGELNSGPLAP